MSVILENLKRKLTDNDIKFEVSKESKNTIYVLFRNTRLYFCTVMAQVVNTDGYKSVELSCTDPFPEVKKTFYFSDEVLECIKESMYDERATECWHKHIGITDSSDKRMRDLSQALCDRFISTFSWYYYSADNEIYVMHSDGKVICSVKYDYVRNFYDIHFYSPFKCACCGEEHVTCPSTSTTCTAIGGAVEVYDNKTIIEMEEYKMADTEVVYTYKKHVMLDSIYNQITRKQLDGYYKGIELRMCNRDDNTIKYITILYGGKRCGEIIGLFNTNGQPESILGIDYFRGDSWLEPSVDDGVRFFKTLFDEKIQEEAAEEIKKDQSAILVSVGRRNGKTSVVLESIWNKFVLSNQIKDVVFNPPATIVFWKDDTKTIVKCQNGEEFDPEKGLAMAVAKKVFGNKHDYYKPFLKWIGKYNKKRFQKALEEAKKITPDEIVHNGHKYVLADNGETVIAGLTLSDVSVKPRCDITINGDEPPIDLLDATEDEKDAAREKLIKEIADMTQTQHKQGGISENEVH